MSTFPSTLTAVRAPSAEVAARLADIVTNLTERSPCASAQLAIRRLTDDAFPRPLDDAGYRDNPLNPGGLPVEISFAEGTPGALRCDLARGHPDAPYRDRHADALRVAGIPATQVSRWHPHLAAERFGAFASAVIPDDGGTVQYKAYLELERDRRVLSAVPGGAAVHHSLLDAVPGLTPHFVALGSNGFDPRLYFECANGIALPALVDWAGRHGLTRQALAAVHAARRLTGGALVLPEAGVMVALRTVRDKVTELKLELTRGVLARDPLDAINAVMMERPRSERAFRAWCGAVGQPVEPTVVSIRISTALPTPLLSVYTGLLP
jgi:hypothetical protein